MRFRKERLRHGKVKLQGEGTCDITSIIRDNLTQNSGKNKGTRNVSVNRGKNNQTYTPLLARKVFKRGVKAC